MAFINLQRVDTDFMPRYLDKDWRTGDYIKCPVCENLFVVGGNDDLPHAWPFLIHAPTVFTGDEEYIEKSEFTCPFLMKPLLLPCECPVSSINDTMAAYKDTQISSFKELLVEDSDADMWIAPEKFLQESTEQYYHMMKLNGTTCNYCGKKFEFSYGFDKGTGKFSCNFMCGCTAVKGAEDLSRLALEFDKEYKSNHKNADYIEAVISLMPKGAKMLRTPLPSE